MSSRGVALRRERYQEHYNEVVLEGLRVLAAGFAVAAGIFAVINFARDQNLAIVALNLVLCGVFSAIWGAHVRQRITPGKAHPLAVCILVLTLLNVLFTFSIRGDALQSNLVALIMIAAGSFLLSARWFLPLLGSIASAWTLVAWKAVGLSPSGFLQLGLTLFAAAVLALVIHGARLRAQERLSGALFELRESEAKYRQLFQKSKDVVTISTPAGKLIDINRAGVELLGYASKEEMLTLDLGQDLYLDPREREDLLDELRTKGFVRGFESRWKTRSGRPVMVEGTTSVVHDERGEPAYFLAILRDVTEKKRAKEELALHREHLEELVVERTARSDRAIARLEREIEERERAEQERKMLESRLEQSQKLESLGVLAGGIAHDFNNLLVGMLGNAGLVRMKLAEDSPCLLHIERIETAAKRAAELTREMLVYAGKGQFVFEDCHLGDLVEEMTNLLEASISKKAELKLEFSAGLPPIRADVTQIRQVVMNLITNASDALGDAAGRITLRLGTEKLDPPLGLDDSGRFLNEDPPSDHFVFFEITDTGCGMDEQTQKRIFDPFFTTKFTGRGLGMAAVLGIVRGHGGEIFLHSEPGRGSTFRVLFPASIQPAAIAEEKERAAPERSGHGKILVVDDEEIVRSFVAVCLENAGFEVLTAEDGMRALEIFSERAHEIALVLLDVTMPRFDGHQTLDELRRIRPSVKVLLSSGHPEEEAGRENGSESVDFIQKPYLPEVFLQKIHDVLA